MSIHYDDTGFTYMELGCHAKVAVLPHLCNKTMRVMEIVEGMFQEEVGREGIEPSWVAPGDFKSPASTISPPPQADIGSLCA